MIYSVTMSHPNNNFFMTLMSNSSFTDFPENKTSDFTVNLPKHITLDGAWEVALAELIYPQTIQNVSRGNDSVIIKFEFIITKFRHTFTKRMSIRPGYYNTIGELVDAVNDQFRKEGGSELLEFNELTEKVFVKAPLVIPIEQYPELVGVNSYKTNEFGAISIDIEKSWPRISAHIHREASLKRGWCIEEIPRDARVKDRPYGEMKTSVHLDGFLALQLGFEPNTDITTTTASTFPKLEFGVPPELLIYCNIIDHQLFGDAHAQVLRITHTLGRGETYGSSCVRSFNNRNYVPIITKYFKTVQISLRSATGTLMPFNFGTSTILLHFRKV